MKLLTTFFFAIVVTLVFGQDYAMFESHTLMPKDGHATALEDAIAEHNRLYHADGPYKNHMFSILSGPRTGALFFAMGPCTFTQLDDRPSSRAHDQDWDVVLSHSEGGAKNVEYWVRSDELAYTPPESEVGPWPLSRVRFFEVSDNSDFKDMQAKFVKTLETMGSKTPRFLYKNRFRNKDGRDWALVSWYKSWADLDAKNWDLFKETYLKLYGEDDWKNMGVKYDEVVLSREDEMRVVRPDLQGDKKK